KRRAQYGKPLLKVLRVGTVITMAGCPFSAANLIAGPPPPPQPCTTDDDPTFWFSGQLSPNGDGTFRLDLSVNTFQVTGVEFANEFTSEDAAVSGVSFNANSL